MIYSITWFLIWIMKYNYFKHREPNLNMYLEVVCSIYTGILIEGEDTWIGASLRAARSSGISEAGLREVGTFTGPPRLRITPTDDCLSVDGCISDIYQSACMRAVVHRQYRQPPPPRVVDRQPDVTPMSAIFVSKGASTDSSQWLMQLLLEGWLTGYACTTLSACVVVPLSLNHASRL